MKSFTTRPSVELWRLSPVPAELGRPSTDKASDLFIPVSPTSALDIAPDCAAAQEPLETIFTEPLSHRVTIDQAVVAEFIDEGHMMRHIRKMRSLYLERLEALMDSVRSELNGLVTIARPDAGMHVVASLPVGVDDRAVAIAVNEMGVLNRPLSLCYLGRKRTSGLILGYAAYSPEQIKDGCRQLAAALSQFQRV